MKNEIYVFSEKASKESGYIFATLKDGSNLKYTAVYQSKEIMEKDYLWDDKVILPLKSEDVVSICLSVNRFNSIVNEDETELYSALDLRTNNTEAYKNAASKLIKELGLKFFDDDKKSNKNKIKP